MATLKEHEIQRVISNRTVLQLQRSWMLGAINNSVVLVPLVKHDVTALSVCIVLLLMDKKMCYCISLQLKMRERLILPCTWDFLINKKTNYVFFVWQFCRLRWPKAVSACFFFQEINWLKSLGCSASTEQSLTPQVCPNQKNWLGTSRHSGAEKYHTWEDNGRKMHDYGATEIDKSTTQPCIFLSPRKTRQCTT